MFFARIVHIRRLCKHLIADISAKKHFSMTSLHAAVLSVVLCYVLSTVAATDLSQCKLDLVFCLDNTGSIDFPHDDNRAPDEPPANWKLIKDFCQDITKQLDISPDGSHVGLVDFGAKARIQFGLNNYQTQSEVFDAINRVRFIGDTTNTTGGLYKSRQVLTDPQYGPRAGVSKIIILITDGNPNIEANTLLEEAQNIRDAGIRVLVIGIAFVTDEEQLKAVAYTPDDYVFAEDFSDLEGISKLVLDDETCKPITTTTTTPEPTTTQSTTTSPPTTTTPAPEPTTTSDFTTTQPLPIC
jgi:hypothetical protein